MRRFILVLALITLVPAAALAAAGYRLVAFNDLGMHCTDGTDYSVFGVLPPYNTVNVQLIDPAGKRIRNPGAITVTYEGVADAAGSINTTSVGKTNFWQWVDVLFGVTLAPDVGLTGSQMPGSANAPRPTKFDASRAWFVAEGVPITPVDDRGMGNAYPMLRFTARDGNGLVLATTDVVLPVSDEMDCLACHASGGLPAARPVIGWAWNSDPARDVKLNVLAIHDQHQAANAKYAAALVMQGYDSTGLRATALGGRPILCARCHPSNALPGLGVQGIQPLTAAVHSRHSDTVDPRNGLTLEASTSRESCYRCHPGVETKCLRGVMASAVTGDGSYAMQCQSCHGSMSEVGAASRVGWLQEPNCQNCHTGTATRNSGQIRYSSAFSSPGVLRTPADRTFATNPDTPAAGFSLYRFSAGHGGLQCEACHGSTHAEFPTTLQNDNAQSIRLQGQAGTLAECVVCHATVPTAPAGGPHGLHPIGSWWVEEHGDIAEDGANACMTCHGGDYRGTVLSRTLLDRQFSTDFGTVRFWRGFQVGCYACHNGPSSEDPTRNRAPVATNASASTAAATTATFILTATDLDSSQLTLRVVSQPAHGRAGIYGTTATYVPDAGFSGVDSFTFAAWDGLTNSNLATASVAVATAPPQPRVSVVKSGAGGGLVTSTPDGINCGLLCNAAFASGTQVTLTALADHDARFAGWSGPCSGTGPCVFTATSDIEVVATFTWVPAMYPLTVTTTGTGRGVVKSLPEAIECGEKCSGTFGSGTTVTLTAIPESHSRFVGWTGACSGTGPCVLVMNQPRNVTATFSRISRRRAL